MKQIVSRRHVSNRWSEEPVPQLIGRGLSGMCRAVALLNNTKEKVPIFPSYATNGDFIGFPGNLPNLVKYVAAKEDAQRYIDRATPRVTLAEAQVYSTDGCEQPEQNMRQLV